MRTYYVDGNQAAAISCQNYLTDVAKDAEIYSAHSPYVDDMLSENDNPKTICGLLLEYIHFLYDESGEDFDEVLDTVKTDYELDVTDEDNN